MSFNDFVSTALSNDIVCIVDDILRWGIVVEPRAAWRWIDGEYADRIVDRFTIIPRIDGCRGYMIAVTLQ